MFFDFCIIFQFTATGLMITARNYLDVYPYENWTAKVRDMCCTRNYLTENER